MVDPSLLTAGETGMLFLLMFLGCPAPDPVPETGHDPDTDAGLSAEDEE